MSKVWVIMGNDFPDSVFGDEKAAEAYVQNKKAEDRAKHDKENMGKHYSPRIHWRSYEFEVQ